MRRKWIGTSMRKERTMRMSEKRMRTPKMTMRSTEKMIMIMMTVMIVMIVMITNGRGRKWKSTRGKEIGIELLTL